MMLDTNLWNKGVYPSSFQNENDTTLFWNSAMKMIQPGVRFFSASAIKK